jgi:hypothetical protein
MSGKILRKLTIKDVIGGKAEILKAAQSGIAKDGDSTGAAVDLMSIIGQVHNVQPGESDNGPYAKLKGSFEATNLLSGEVFSGVNTAILPNFVSDSVVAALKEGAESVQFAIVFSVKYDVDAATMYVFEARSLMPTKPSDALESIKNGLKALGVSMPEAKALPAPTPAAATEPAPQAEPEPQAASKSGGKKK